jgi:glycosyltransferase involved in cell wall biosynthesis
VFMKPHIDVLAKHYDVTLIADASQDELSELLNSNVKLISLGIERKINIIKDVQSLISLFFIFQREKFSSVHSLMPKSGLLAMIAGFLARVPCRFHTFTGQVWANKVGFNRWGLKFLDKLVVFCATELLTDSFTQKKFLIDEGIVPAGKINVLANGSICGVDLLRFNLDPVVRSDVRKQLDIPFDALVYLFLGRLNKDKGVLDLAVAFSNMVKKVSSAFLLIVGPDENGLDDELSEILSQCRGKYRRIDFTSQPEKYMAASDVLCLPSYREGFGSVIIEAAAMRVPAIVSNIYGLIDAVEDGKTGILHPLGDVDAIEKCMLKMFNDERFRCDLASQAYERACRSFSKDIVVFEMMKFYEKNLCCYE